MFLIENRRYYDDYAGCLSRPRRQIAGEFQPLTDRCLYYHSGSPASAIVLDDLKEQGFKMVDRTVEMDMQHCLLVMKALVQSHAASAVLHLKDPEIFKPFSEGFYCERQRKIIELLYQNNLKNLAKESEKWPLFNDRFACKLHRGPDKVVEFLTKLLKRETMMISIISSMEISGKTI